MRRTSATQPRWLKLASIPGPGVQAAGLCWQGTDGVTHKKPSQTEQGSQAAPAPHTLPLKHACRTAAEESSSSLQQEQREKKKIGKQTEQARRSGTTLFFHMVPGKGFEAMMHSHNAARLSWRQLHCGGKGGAVLALWQARQHQGTQHGDTLPPSPPSAPQWGPVPSIPPPPRLLLFLASQLAWQKEEQEASPWATTTIKSDISAAGDSDLAVLIYFRFLAAGLTRLAGWKRTRTQTLSRTARREALRNFGSSQVFC